MPFVPVPNTVEVVPQFLYDLQRCANVHHVEKGSAWTTSDMELVAAAYRDWWDTNIRTAFAPTTLSLVSVIVRDLTTQSSPALEFTVGMPLVGTVAAALPNHVTLAVKWITALRGRSFRGRTYHVGLAEGHVLNNQLGAAFVNPLLAAYDALRDALETAVGGLVFVVVSKFANGVPRATGVTTPIIGTGLDTTVDSQRRRLPGRGV